jgi:ribosomal protein L11 methyltransferase
LEAIGFEQTDTHLLAYFEKDNFKSYEVNNLVKEFTFNITSIPEQNWNAVWESNFEPVVVDDFCAIRADFHQPIKNVQHEIIITPKMSFGTGHHATTYMMIEQMSNIDFTKKRVFDFGTGTGILAILAQKLGAASITAIDNDEWSIENAKENFQKNDAHSITLYRSSAMPKDSFDIILANINRNVLNEYASALVSILSPKGVLLVSGILKEDERVIVAAFNILQPIKVQQNKNWISILFRS